MPPGCIISTTIDVGSAAGAFALAWPQWQRHGVTAVVCGTDTHAYGVLQEARVAGVRIPEELAVAGFDDLPYSATSNPSLTSVHLPATPLGAEGRRATALPHGGPPLGAAAGDAGEFAGCPRLHSLAPVPADPLPLPPVRPDRQPRNGGSHRGIDGVVEVFGVLLNEPVLGSEENAETDQQAFRSPRGPSGEAWTAH